MAGIALALDLDLVLADTRPLWDAWLEDAARRARVELDVPEDREEAAAVLDEALGDWRPLLSRFAADRAPLWIRPRPDTNAALRRFAAGGARIGVFSDAPVESWSRSRSRMRAPRARWRSSGRSPRCRLRSAERRPS